MAQRVSTGYFNCLLVYCWLFYLAEGISQNEFCKVVDTNAQVVVPISLTYSETNATQVSKKISI